jgi:hypothetical protein
MSLRSTAPWLAFGIGAIAAVAVCVVWWHATKYNPTPLSLDGSSDQLRHTVVVPTLDAPIPERNSAIWCASFQLAWNALVDDVVKEPIRLENAQSIADRLNNAKQSVKDVNADAVYAAGGLAKDGIIERIQSQMAMKFPHVPRPKLEVPPIGVVAYAYLAASAKYDFPFFENDQPFPFIDSAGKKTAVTSFSIREKDDYAYHQLRQQVQVLYCPQDAIWREKEVPEFVVDLCKTSQPYQIVVARVDRKSTLSETLADVQQKVMLNGSSFGVRDTLIIPNLAWRINHRFKELEGKDKRFLNPALDDLYLDTALQTIEFRLDRSGAELQSESKVYVKPGASFFHVNRPFLLYMKKRGAEHPFFVAWIENAELLKKK